MPVGTGGRREGGAAPRPRASSARRILLANTYHLMLRPGRRARRASSAGCTASPAGTGPSSPTAAATRSSASPRCARSTRRASASRATSTARAHLLSPERSIEIQQNLGRRHRMAFDECPPGDAPARGGRRGHRAHHALGRAQPRARTRRADQWLFGIVQGGVHLDLREQSARELVAIGFPGLRGRRPLGRRAEAGRATACSSTSTRCCPRSRPRYLMGVGTPEDLIDGVARGIDMFDCVLPTRNARNGQLFTSRGPALDPQRPLPGRPAPARSRLRAAPPAAPRAAPTCATSTMAGEMTAATLHDASTTSSTTLT